MTTNNNESGYLVSTDLSGATIYNYVTQFTNGKPMQITTPDGYITSGDINLSNQTTGTLPIARGGTSITSYNAGDLIYSPALNTLTTLPIGTNGQVLSVVLGAPSWLTLPGTGTVTSVDGSGGSTGLTLTGGPITMAGTLTLGGTLGALNGGTSFSSYTAGDLIYSSALNTLSKLPIGTAGQLLSVGGGGLPQWSTVSIPTGTVTSVDLALPGTVFNVTGSPVTSAGTLTGSFINQVANTVFSAPNGAPGTPTFRTLVSADIPSLSGIYMDLTTNQTAAGNKTFSNSVAITPVNNQIILGGATTTTISAIAPVASRNYKIIDVGNDSVFVMTDGAQTINDVKTFTTPIAATSGGTGQNIYTLGDILYANSTTTLAKRNIGTAGQYLTVSGGLPTWATLTNVTTFSAGTTGFTPSVATSGAITLAGTLNAVNGGTGQNIYTVGDILYSNTTTTLAKLADIAIGNALISGGVGVAPSYGKIGLTTHVTGTLPIANGGTNITTYTTGDIVYCSAANVLSNLPIGTAGQVLTISGGLPTWANSTGGVTTMGANVAATANSATITGTTLQMAQSSPLNRGVIHGFSNSTFNSLTTLGYNAGNAAAGTTSAVYIGYDCGKTSTQAGNIAVGNQCLNAMTTGLSNCVFGAAAMANSNAVSDNCALGASALTLSSNSIGRNVAVGNLCANNVLTGTGNVAVGYNAMATTSTGSDNIHIGRSTTSTTNSASNEIVIGAATIGQGSNTFTVRLASIPVIVNTALHINTTTGQLTRAASSMRYKTPLPDPVNLPEYANYIFQLIPRAYYYNDDPTHKPMVGYYAEEVAQIVVPGQTTPFFNGLIQYTTLNDQGEPDPNGNVTVPDGLNYAGFVVPLIQEVKNIYEQLNPVNELYKMAEEEANESFENRTLCVDFNSAKIRPTNILDSGKIETNVIGFYKNKKLHSTGVHMIPSECVKNKKWLQLNYKCKGGYGYWFLG